MFIPRHELETPIKKLCAGIKQSEPLPGVPRILFPGELEEERRHIRLRDGIPVLADVLEALEASCREMGMMPPHQGALVRTIFMTCSSSGFVPLR